MKKLMTIMATAATALFAFGDVTLPSGTSLEGLTAGEALDPTVASDDAGTGVTTTYWVLQGDDQADLLVTNYESGVTLPTRPAQFAQETNNNYLKIDTQGRLYRSIGANDQTTEFENKAAIGNGIYLDTLVQFTAADDEFGADAITAGDKIAIQYVEHDDDPATELVNEAYTNFVVRAGYVSGSSVTATNYFLTLPDQAAFDKTAWHRLTVRAISNVGNANAPVGFVVYVDGVNLVYDVGVAAGDQAYVESLNSVVQTYLYNNTTHALLPSLVSSTYNYYDTLSAVAFNGNGCVDDISFTDAQPTFIQEGTTVTIAWDANVATYTVVAGETTLIDAEAVSGAGSRNLLLDNSIKTLTVTATYATGYEAGTWTVSGSDAAAISGSTFTVAAGAQLNIASMLPLFQVGETHYGSFAEALAAAVAAGTEQSPATIKLLANFAGTASEPALAFSAGYVVLDLNGKTIQALDSDYSVANTGASLTIIDSASGGTIAVPQMSNPQQLALGSLLVYGDTAVTVVRAGTFEGVVTVATSEAQPTDVLTVYGGQFYDPDYDEEEQESVFYLVKYAGEYNFLPEGVTYNYDGSNYFTVSESAPAPTVVQIPAALLGIVYDGSLKTGVVEQVGFTLSGNTAVNAGSYTATAKLENGYVWSDTTTEDKEISWSIAAKTDAEVVVTLQSEIAEYSAQLEFPTATASVGNEAVLGTATWDPATITEPSAGVTNDYTVTFMVTNGNFTGSTGSATFKVYKAAQSGGWDPKPEDIDPSATAATKYPELAETALATANAQKLTAWAEENKVDFAAVKASADTYVNAYLLNCAPAEVEAANADFKATITVNADGTVTVTAPGDYNVTPTIQGKQSLSDAEWHDKKDGDKFFRAVLGL